jgi:O-methyltransferase
MAAPPDRHTPADLYLDLLKGILTRAITGEDDLVPHEFIPAQRPLHRKLAHRYVQRFLRGQDLVLAREVRSDRFSGAKGGRWPLHAETMIGRKRLDNVQECVRTVIQENVPGDVIETGVWRGGATILMRACLAAYGDQTRKVWVADSFQGLPPPDEENYPADKGDRHHTKTELAISREIVEANFARYGLLDDRVDFLVGWFKDTLPTAPIEKLAVMRLDGDLYESTIQALEALYPRLSPGGFVIIDDYGDIEQARRATEDFRSLMDIRAPIVDIDGSGVYWRRER